MLRLFCAVFGPIAAAFTVCALGCSDPGPGPMPDADVWMCGVRDAGPSCSAVFTSQGDAGTPGDLVLGTCDAVHWGELERCAFGPSCAVPCGPSPTLQAMWRSAECDDCLIAKCAPELGACQADQ
jgi:hypothetical protein